MEGDDARVAEVDLGACAMEEEEAPVAASGAAASATGATGGAQPNPGLKT